MLAPNPIQQQAVITLLQPGQENYIRHIEVRDSKGQLLMRRDEVNKFSESIDMSTLPDGFYLITVITNNSSEVLKAVVNRN